MKKSKSMKIVVLAVLAFSSPSINSFAADSGFGIGGFVGYGNLFSTRTGSSSASAVSFGADVYYRFHPTWEITIDWNMLPYSPTGTTTSNSMMTIVVELNYHLAVLSPLYFGIRAGIGIINAAGTINSNVNYMTTNFDYGAQAGYDFNLGSGLTVGPQVVLDIMPTNTADLPTASAYNYTQMIFKALAAVKYNF